MNATTQGSRTDSNSVFFAFTSAVIFLTIGTYVLYFGHPHEDAYILYIYSEILSGTGDIAYFQGGEPTEGATDFLWMILISVLNLIGINSALAALLLNSLGVFLFSYLAIEIGSKHGKSRFASWSMAIILPLCITSQAAYAGFSVALYSSLIGLLFLTSIIATGIYVAAIPIIGLILALFRPDGAIIGIIVCITVAIFLHRDERKIYLAALMPCMFIGIAYFAWRWSYFGQFLPLPLIVKGQSDSALPGLTPNIAWAKANIIIIALGVASIFAREVKIRIALMTLPVVAYMVAITFAIQSQNVAFRFQAPFATILLLGLSVSLHLLLDKNRIKDATAKSVISTSLLFFSLHLIAASALQTISLTRYLTNDDYINFFPYHLSKHVPENSTVALTEAGRFAYWLPGRKFDLVGLNTPETAIDGASVSFLESLDADLVFIHHANTIPSLICKTGEDFCEVSSERFLTITNADNSLSFLDVEDRATRAAAAATAYLVEYSLEYTLYAVRYGGSYTHLYAVRHEGEISLADFLSSLTLSFSSEGQLSYWEMINK